MSFRKAGWLAALAAVTVSLAAIAPAQAQQKQTLLNVSYDPTRELYRAIDDAFAKQYKDKAGVELTIRQSHGGSGRQARSVIDGLEADVVTLALAYDIDAIADRGLLRKTGRPACRRTTRPTPPPSCSWCARAIPSRSRTGTTWSRTACRSSPPTKTSGGARWNYLAAWAYALEKNGGSEDKAKAYVGELLKHVPVLDTGARGATTTFVERGVGDVLLAWENEAFLALEELGPDKFDIVVPSLSILAEPPVAVVDKIVDKKGTRAAAQAYLEFLYTPAAQEIIAKNYYRPIDKDVAAKYESKFPKVKLVKIDDKIFGGWRKAQKDHFSDGGTFDQIYQPQKK